MRARKQPWPSMREVNVQIFRSGVLVVLTFIAVSNRIKVDVVLVIADEEQAEPRIKGINWHNKQDADDVTLLIGDSVGTKVCINLQ